MSSRDRTPLSTGASDDSDPKLQELVSLIKESHKQSTNDELQQRALQASMEYINENVESRHMFCDKGMFHPSIHALILFSFPDNQALSWYKEKAAHSLNSCPKCISLFHRGRAKLKMTFAIERGIDASSVQRFINIILEWEASRLLERLKRCYDEFRSLRESKSDISVPKNILMGLAECLSAPGLLRINPELKALFGELLYFLLSIDHKFIKTANSLTAGYIYLLFDGDSVQKKWAFKILEDLKQHPGPALGSISSDILEEFEVHFLNIQSPKFLNDQTCELFYRNLLPILQLYDTNIILNKLSNPQDLESVQKVLDYDVLSLMKLLQKHIMNYFVKPFPYILRVFKFMLQRLGDKFWNHTSNYTFHNFIDTISDSPNFVRCLELLPLAQDVSEPDPDACLDDMISWIGVFNDTLVASKQQQALNRIALNLITHMESQNKIPLENRAIIFEKACTLVSKALSIPSTLYSPGFSTDLLVRSDSRVVVDQKLLRFMDYATCKAIFFPPSEKFKNGELARKSTEVLCKAMRFDLLSFAQNSYDIHNKRKPPTLKFSPALFKNLLNQNFAVQLELAFQILSSMENVSGIIPLDGPHKLEVKQVLTFLQEFFVQFSDVDVKNSKLILSNPHSLSGYWSCVFSSDPNLYQSAVDILYETFDASGRLEGVHGLLSNNLDACIRAINNNLTNLIFIKFYEPCPRAVKVLSDVIHALNNKINGLFSNSSNFDGSVKEALIHFWNRCWNFLDLIYVETLQWANKYSDEDLIEFTRDTLDLSHAVLQCFKTINKISQEGDARKTFMEITNTFPHMLVWLRLSDSGLLASCVKLISSTVDLATEIDLELETNVIILLAKYGSRAKKFNNKLTNQQSAEIIARAKIFDKDLVEKTVNESDNYRKSRLLSEEATSSEVSSRDVSPLPVTYTNTNSSRSVTPTITPSAARPRGQMKITNFGSLSKTPSTAPAKTSLPLSALEKARLGMRADKAPAREIKPARPPGFNQREKPQRSKKEQSSDEESEDEDVRTLFNLPKEKKEGITILGDNKSLKKPRKSAADERKREEEFSRLRLNVNLKPLYQQILKWSFHNDSDYPNGEQQKYPSVSDNFNSAEDYVKSYEPLLFLECWQAILSAKKREANKPILINIASKTTVDNFFEVFFNFTKTELSEKGITESDLVVLALYDSPGRDPTASDVQNSKMTCFAKVNEIKYVKGDSVDVSLRVNRTAALNNTLSPHTPIILMKVMQMTTIEREYSSLHGLKYYNLSKQILHALPDKGPDLSTEDVNKVKNIYEVNDSQAKAIASSTKASGFFLIQGPPGTGKTKTILGIIGHMISSFRDSNAIAAPSSSSVPVVHSSNFDALKSKKVLVCAPSNAAVDELVLRLKDGIRNSKGTAYIPKLVRLGRTDAINTAVKDMTLEELVDAQLGKSSNSGETLRALFKELGEVRGGLDQCRDKLNDTKDPVEAEKIRTRKRELTQKANVIKKKLDEERENQASAYRSREINRRNIQAKILGEAEIICSTLSGAAHDMVANIGIKFDSVVIDEACQCTELSAIIPLRYGCQRCIMVGDPNQLPPTVLSSVAADSKYDQSLFVRMANHEKPLLLDVQYRMHSSISKFPSKKFYEGALKDGPDMDSLTTRPWHQNKNFPPYQFYDIIEGQESQNSKTFSYINKVEIEIAMELIENLFTKYPSINFTNKIGVITPYKEQNRSLQQAFVRRFGNTIKREISFNTIDGFQGQEKEIIIMSCVRADSTKGGVGFLRDFRRMNVALTRSKCSLWILGHHNSLVKNELWNDLISDAKERDMFATVKRGFTSSVTPRSYQQNVDKTSSYGYVRKNTSSIEGPNNINTHGKKSTDNETTASSVASSASEIPVATHIQSSASRKGSNPAINLPSIQPKGKKDSVFGSKSHIKSASSSNNAPVKPKGAASSSSASSSSSNMAPADPRVAQSSSNTIPVNHKGSESSLLKSTDSVNVADGSNNLPLPNSTNKELPRIPTGPRSQNNNHKRSTTSSIFVQRKKRR